MIEYLSFELCKPNKRSRFIKIEVEEKGVYLSTAYGYQGMYLEDAFVHYHSPIQSAWLISGLLKDLKINTWPKVLWIYDKSHLWSASAKNRVLTNSFCPYCAHRAVLSGFSDLETLFPDIAKEWSDKNLRLLPSDVMAFSNKKAWWHCKTGHEWYDLISSRSGGHGCPYCCGHLKWTK